MKALLTLFLIVFVDLLGFGIILPLFPFVAERLGADPWLITFGGAGVYALAQVFAAPFWGRLSDSHGRRLILLLSTAGAVLGYLWMGVAESLSMLIASRAFSGAMSGNISAAFAYVADVTGPKERARGLGMIGAAFGLGFMFGPAIGGMLGGEDPGAMNFLLPALVAAGLSALAFLGTLFFLRESLPPAERRPWTATKRSLRMPLAAVAGRPAWLGVVGAVFLVGVGGTTLQSIFPVWGPDVLGLSPRDVGFVFFAMGLVGVTVQGTLVGRFVALFGEKRVLYASAAAHAVGYAVMGFAWNHVSLAIGAACFAAGHASFNTTASSLLSLEAEPGAKGAVLGAMQAASAASRIVGPATSGAVYSAYGPQSPFAVGALLLLPAVLWLRGPHRSNRPPQPGHPDQDPA